MTVNEMPVEATLLTVRCRYRHYYERGLVTPGHHYAVVEIREGGTHYRLIDNHAKYSILPVDWFEQVGDGEIGIEK